MANLTYTQIYSMTESELSDFNNTNMQEGNFEDIKSINEKLSAISTVQEIRKKLYPSIEEQMDMQYWDAVNDTTRWQDKIAQIKTDNPLPQD
jgi:hypothetical protein